MSSTLISKCEIETAVSECSDEGEERCGFWEGLDQGEGPHPGNLNLEGVPPPPPNLGGKPIENPDLL